MDINGWLTVITVLTAIFALMPKEEIFVLSHQTSKLEKVALLGVFIFLLPFLIQFEFIKARFGFFRFFTFSWGIEPQQLALIFFYISFIWIIARLFWIKPQGKVDSKLIIYYTTLLYQKSFEDFFTVFTKYNSPELINKNWSKFYVIFTDPTFLSGVYKKHNSYLIQFWDNFTLEADFKTLFSLYLENYDSAYYIELQSQPSSYSISEKPFLYQIIKRNLNRSIDHGLIGMIEDHCRKILTNQTGKESIYNQKLYYAVEAEQGYDLPLYYHIKFIDLLYNTSISDDYQIRGIRQTFFATLVKLMIDNVNVNDVDMNVEYPTNYHWLISEIAAVQGDLIEDYGKKNYDSNSDYNGHFPFSFWLCLDVLFDGLERGKVTKRFVDSIGYYHFFSTYFSHEIDNQWRHHMEEEVIGRIPAKYLSHILEKTFDEKFARSLYQFCQEGSRYPKSVDNSLQRLFNFLNSRGTIQELIEGYNL